MTTKPVRVRFAPSPTGSLHVGGARTALYNYLFAKKMGGSFVLRIEDTDLARSTQASLDSLVQDLNWLGLIADEGYSADLSGSYGPYKQSERLDLYQRYADQLLESGQAYYCFLTDDEMEKQRSEAKETGAVYQIKSPYRDMPLAQAKAKRETQPNATIRFKNTHADRIFIVEDLVRGSIKLPGHMVGDFVIMRSDGMPVYNFCCAIDDALMAITHVLRGEEHLSNTLRQMMILEALGLPAPQFGHLSIILNDAHKKLSKRDGAVCCDAFRQQGFLAEALLNYIALLGWSHPDGLEILNIEQMIEAFSLDRLNAAAPVFDPIKLHWVNTQHLHSLPIDTLKDLIQPMLIDAQISLPETDSWLEQALALIQTELHTLHDAIPALNALVTTEYTLDAEATEVIQWEMSAKVITMWRDMIEQHPETYCTSDQIKAYMKAIQAQTGSKGKALFMPLRVAILGKAHGADLKTITPLISTALLSSRAHQCLSMISAS